MMDRLLARWRKPRIFSVTDFTDFLERSAWLVAQKSVVGYCHVKTKLPVHELMTDKPFEDAYEMSVRHAHAAVLADLVEIALGYLKSAASDRGPMLARSLLQIYVTLQAAQTALPGGEPMTWHEETEALRVRLDIAAQKPARAIREISLASAERIFETLPFHPRLSEPDKPAVMAGVQFLVVGLAHEFERIDYGALAPELLAHERP